MHGSSAPDPPKTVKIPPVAMMLVVIGSLALGTILGGDLRSRSIFRDHMKEMDQPGIVKDVATVAGVLIVKVETRSNIGRSVIAWVVAKDDLWGGDACEVKWIDGGDHNERFAFKSKRE